jgi:hypothetical protein
MKKFVSRPGEPGAKQNRCRIRLAGYAAIMSVVEQICEKAQALPEPAQKTVLELVEKLVEESSALRKPKPKFGSAKGLIHIAPDFDEPLEDFKPYLE